MFYIYGKIFGTWLFSHAVIFDSCPRSRVVRHAVACAGGTHGAVAREGLRHCSLLTPTHPLHEYGTVGCYFCCPTGSTRTLRRSSQLHLIAVYAPDTLLGDERRELLPGVRWLGELGADFRRGGGGVVYEAEEGVYLVLGVGLGEGA